MDFCNHLVQVSAELVYSYLFTRRNEYAWCVFLCDPAVLEFLKGIVYLLLRLKRKLIILLISISIYLVEYYEDRFIYSLDILQGLLYNLYMLLEVRMRYVNHMHEDICLADFVKSTLECFYELMREFSDETYSIAEKERYVFYHYFSYCSIKGSEEFVFSKYITLREQVHKRALTYVCISYE